MAALSTLYDHIFPEVPGATQALVDQAIRQALRTFLERTKLYKVDVTVAVTNGVSVAATPPAGFEISEVVGETDDRWVKFGTVKLYPVDKIDLREGFLDHTTATGSPSAYVMEDQVFRVYPSASGTLVAKVSLVPTATATTFPDFILRRDVYKEGIASGAKYYMMRKPKTPHAFTDQAVFYLQKFEHAIGVGSVNEHRNETRKTLRSATMLGLGI